MQHCYWLVDLLWVRLADTSGEDLQKQIALNFETAYFVTRPLFEHLMKNKRGTIVFIGARPALNPAQGKGLIAYSLSKSLLFKLAEFLNEEAKGINVSISVVVPSTLDTPLNRKVHAGCQSRKLGKTFRNCRNT